MLQVFNDTEIPDHDLATLRLADRPQDDMYLILAQPSPEPMCDCSLGHALGRTLVYNAPQIRHKMREDSIIILSHIEAYISKGYIFNVLQSGNWTSL